MSTEKTREEIRLAYIAAMGEDLGELFDAIASEVTWIYWRWQQYLTLFVKKSSRVDLLNQSAPFFFYVVQGVLFESTILAVARLIGPPKSRGKPNLAVDRLAELISDPTLKGRVDELIRKAKEDGAFTIDWRHRHLAHRDLALAQRKAHALETATVAKVNVVLADLRDVLNCIEEVYCDATTLYDSPTIHDAETLLYFIRDGILRQQDRSNKWRQGLSHEDDNSPREPI